MKMDDVCMAMQEAGSKSPLEEVGQSVSLLLPRALTLEAEVVGSREHSISFLRSFVDLVHGLHV